MLPVTISGDAMMVRLIRRKIHLADFSSEVGSPTLISLSASNKTIDEHAQCTYTQTRALTTRHNTTGTHSHLTWFRSLFCFCCWIVCRVALFAIFAKILYYNFLSAHWQKINAIAFIWWTRNASDLYLCAKFAYIQLRLRRQSSMQRIAQQQHTEAAATQEKQHTVYSIHITHVPYFYH